MREAFSALSNSIQGRNLRKHLVVITPLLPASQLQDLLLENVPVETILGTRFHVEDEEQVRRYPFSIPALNVKSEQPVMVHLLPPSRIVEKDRYEAVPLQMWRFNPERHPNILRSLSLWESPDWTFLTEEREPGFALSRLMAERVTLNPNEVLVLMRQVCSGLEQAVECGVHRVDLHPSNILLQVGKRGPLLSREIERFIQKRLDAWPKFLVKLRPHMTMRSLYEPLLVDMDIPDGAHQEEHLMDRDFKHRSFVALAAYLLSGQRQSSGAPQFPESLPEAAATYVRECMELSKRYGKTPAPAEFMARFEESLSAPTVDLATRLRGQSVAIEEMESAGAVSDFDGEWGNELSEGELSDGMPFDARRMKAHDFNSVLDQKRSLPWAALAAAAVVVLGLGAWFLLGGAPSESSSPSDVAMPSSVAEGPESNPALDPAPQGSADEAVPAKLSTTVSKEVDRPTADSPVATASKSPAAASSPNLAVAEEKKESAVEQSVSTVAGATVTSSGQPSSTAAAAVQVSPPSSAKPPVKVAKEPLTIRRAILPSQEELDRMKQGHVQNKVGSLPVMSTASQMPIKKEKLKP